MDETDRHDMPAEMCLKEQQDVELKHCRSANKVTGLPKQREKWGKFGSVDMVSWKKNKSGLIVIAAANLCSD